jgi:hypothetical protein
MGLMPIGIRISSPVWRRPVAPFNVVQRTHGIVWNVQPETFVFHGQPSDPVFGIPNRHNYGVDFHFLFPDDDDQLSPVIPSFVEEVQQFSKFVGFHVICSHRPASTHGQDAPSKSRKRTRIDEKAAGPGLAWSGKIPLP